MYKVDIDNLINIGEQMHILKVLLLFAILFSSKCFSDITILSFNTLHLGYGNSNAPNYLQDKYNKIKSEIKPSIDLALFQEVMPNFNPSNIAIPGRTWYPAQLKNNNYKGLGSYREAYLISVLPDKKRFEVVCHVSLTNTDIGLNANLARPPDMVLLKYSDKAIWIINFHAIWGKRVGGRQNELQSLLDFADSKLIVRPINPSKIDSSCNKPNLNMNMKETIVVIAGDFNLSPKQIDQIIEMRKNSKWFLVQRKLSTINPTGLTANSYDHFVIHGINSANTKSEVIFKNCSPDIQKPLCKTYLDTVSDHIGVTLTLTIP